MKIFGAVLIAGSLLAGCSEEKLKPSVNKSLKPTEMPSQESWNSEVYFTDHGLLKAVLHSSHLQQFDSRNETLLENMKIDFYNQQGVKASVLTSKRGRVDDLTKNMYAIDSVVAVNDSGVVLRTSELMWRNSDRKIVTNKFVTIQSPKEKIQGYGFEADQTLKNYVIYNITFITALEEKQK